MISGSFSGSSKVRVDDKGRLAIPNRYRDSLAKSGGLVLTLHPHRHLTLYPSEKYDQLRESLMAMANMDYTVAHIQEIIIGCAEEVSLDSAGRIMLSSSLRACAGIERETLLFGVGESIHIWDERAWEQRRTLILARLQDDNVSEEWKNLKL